jgi:hypothetical protein
LIDFASTYKSTPPLIDLRAPRLWVFLSSLPCRGAVLAQQFQSVADVLNSLNGLNVLNPSALPFGDQRGEV